MKSIKFVLFFLFFIVSNVCLADEEVVSESVSSTLFDERVNALLSQGWKVKDMSRAGDSSHIAVVMETVPPEENKQQQQIISEDVSSTCFEEKVNAQLSQGLKVKDMIRAGDSSHIAVVMETAPPEENKKQQIISESVSSTLFEKRVNALLKQGWKVKGMSQAGDSSYIAVVMELET